LCRAAKNPPTDQLTTSTALVRLEQVSQALEPRVMALFRLAQAPELQGPEQPVQARKQAPIVLEPPARELLARSSSLPLRTAEAPSCPQATKSYSGAS